ncbi:hypothetical protein PMG71_05245 [Roseofilum sp. BLCC_M154]|uniref:Uncharacterized protein n=1 Tax=Roseofilum acuticapitatum BLCC-M154 TaxID=3022444 RepID=A0ABT7APJ6_9CYAN|nr:hypothetical protein [Roseofilum acuticapitatum]MDJ1168824.1 hypothetical protein [Roseofilum acuticapitatum BLCC-M154]
MLPTFVLLQQYTQGVHFGDTNGLSDHPSSQNQPSQNRVQPIRETQDPKPTGDRYHGEPPPNPYTNDDDDPPEDNQGTGQSESFGPVQEIPKVPNFDVDPQNFNQFSIPVEEITTFLWAVAIVGVVIVLVAAAPQILAFLAAAGLGVGMRASLIAIAALFATSTPTLAEENPTAQPNNRLAELPGQPSGDVLYVGTINFTQLCDRKKPEGYYYNEYPKTDNLTQGLCTVTKPMGRELAPRIEINFDIADGAQYCRERFSQHQDPGIRQVASSAFVQVSMSHWNRNREKRWDCCVSCPPNDTRCSPFNPQNGPFSR